MNVCYHLDFVAFRFRRYREDGLGQFMTECILACSIFACKLSPRPESLRFVHFFEDQTVAISRWVTCWDAKKTVAGHVE